MVTKINQNTPRSILHKYVGLQKEPLVSHHYHIMNQQTTRLWVGLRAFKNKKSTCYTRDPVYVKCHLISQITPGTLSWWDNLTILSSQCLPYTLYDSDHRHGRRRDPSTKSGGGLFCEAESPVRYLPIHYTGFFVLHNTNQKPKPLDALHPNESYGLAPTPSYGFAPNENYGLAPTQSLGRVCTLFAWGMHEFWSWGVK